jgi:hypothetical protein
VFCNSLKLEEKINNFYLKEIEIISWGKCGWSTLDDYEFFEKQGVKFNIDLLMVAFVANDPDLGDRKQKYLRLNRKEIVRHLRKIFPNVVDFISDHLENLAVNFSDDYGYLNWHNKLYSEENLKRYSLLLGKFSNFCSVHGVRLLFVLTPSNYEQFYRHRFDKIIPLIKEANIEYLALFPPVSRDLKKYKVRDLWANPANSPPGNLVTEVFANEVFQFIKKNVESGGINLKNEAWKFTDAIFILPAN